MDQSEYANIYALESTHFYYQATHELVLSLVKKYLLKTSDYRPMTILDAGCGTGLLASRLGVFGQVSGVDYHPLAVAYAKSRHVRAKLGTITKLPFPSSSFDLVVCIDVIYHRRVTSAQRAIREFTRVLKPGGLLILRTAALPWLTSEHDLVVHTKTRYTHTTLAKLIPPQLPVLKLSYVHMLLFLPALIQAILFRLNHHQPHSAISAAVPNWLNQLLIQLLSLETWALTYIDLPLGLGLILVATKAAPATTTVNPVIK